MYIPICSMYGIFANICPNNHPSVGNHTIHGAYGTYCMLKWIHIEMIGQPQLRHRDGLSFQSLGMFERPFQDSHLMVIV